MAGARLGDGTSRVVVTGVPMSAVPGTSRFWSADADSGGKLLTWEDFFLVRDADAPVSAQLELMPSGDFIARSNLVERLYRRVNPDDWDGDGIQNGDDPAPLFCSGDFFGPDQTLPDEANPDAYCWVDVVVRGAESLVMFSGDGPSNLPDPSFIAKAGATNRVMLLIGKSYQVASRMPISCVGRSSSDIEVEQDSETGLSIRWPVEIECIAEGSMRMLRSGGHSADSFEMRVLPDNLGGGFSWTNGCCSISSLGGWRYCFTCGENCLCGGCGASGYYGYEGYRLAADGGWCGCYPDGCDDGDAPELGENGGVSVSFSRDAVIFEDAYETSPGEWVQKRSSVVRLRIAASGGDHGGTVTFTHANLDKLSALANGPLNIPSSVAIAPHQSYGLSFRCEGASASAGENDVMVCGRFAENGTGEIYESEDCLTVFRVEIRTMVDAPQNTALNRHRFGVRERVHCIAIPSGSGLIWTSATSDGVGSGGIYRCPLHAFSKPLTATCGDTDYSPMVVVVEPSGIEARNPRRVTFGVGSGRAGWVGLRQELYVKPFDVSFSQIMMEEVPCTTGGHGGYFANPAFSVIWYHTTTNGAGVWLNVNSDNRMGAYDTAALTMELSRVKPDGSPTEDKTFGWADGWITWDVPFGWTSPEAVSQNSQANPFREFNPQAGHRFSITADGTVTVRKFGNEAVREAYEDTSQGGGL